MKKPIAVLDQFVEKGRTITYMTAFANRQNDGRMPNSHAVFKIYLKHRFSFIERLLKKDVKWAGKHLIANQVHP